MTPLKLSLKNFIGIQAGQGKSDFMLDLEPILKEAQLVAIVGDNGSGKTTVMDNLHPFRIMPSRAPSYSPASFSFYDNTIGEAMKELEFEHEGIRYKSVLIVKATAKTKTTSAYLHRWSINNWVSAWDANGVASDGKTATYDAALESILGTPEMFFTSVFSSQGKRALSSYSNSEIKALMAELLDLDHIRDLQGKAKEVVKDLNRAHEGLNNQLADIAGKETALSIMQRSGLEFEANITASKAQKTAARQSVDRALLAHREAQQDAGANLKLEEKRAELKAQISGSKQKIGLLGRELLTLQQTRDLDIGKLDGSIQSVRTSLDKSIDGLELKIAEQTRILDMQTDIEAAKRALGELETESTALVALVAEKREAEEQRHEIAIAHESTRQKLNAIIEAGKESAQTLNSRIEQAALIKEVPCTGTELQPRCKLLRSANEAAAMLPELTEKTDELRARHAVIKTSLDELSSKLGKFSGLDVEIQALLNRQQQLHQRSVWNHRTAALEDGLKNAAAVIDTLNDQITEIKAASQANLNSLEERGSELIHKFTADSERVHRDIELAKTQRDVFETELESMPPAADDAALTLAQTKLAEAEAALDTIERQLQAAIAQAAQCQTEIGAIENWLKDAATIKTRAAVLTDEIAQWTLLITALGPDGIIALAIDDAGPTLSALTNDLLLAAYGPRFTVSIKTQREKSDGTLAEVFDIKIFDSETGDQKSIGAMSGGEKVYLNEALCRAIALYQSQSSGKRYGCLFADESDGALDAEKKQQFVSMKRKMLELGGYANEIFISHSAEAFGLADYVIDFNRLN